MITIFPLPPQAVTGTVATVAPTLPLLTQEDDKQYDDDGIPYVNPNVPGADIATGDKQSQQLNALQAIQAGVVVTNFPAATAVSNFPATQPVSGTVAISGTVPVSGSLTPTALSTPTVTQDDDKQYDDDGVPYVNPNVPGADIATGDKQTQILAALATALPRVVSGSVAITGPVNVSSAPVALAPNAPQEMAGQLQRTADLMEQVITELRVISMCLVQLSQPQIDCIEALRADANVIN